MDILLKEVAEVFLFVKGYEDEVSIMWRSNTFEYHIHPRINRVGHLKL